MEMEHDEVEHALRILVEAEKIKQDDKLMEKVVKMADSEKDAVKSIADLKKKYDKIVEEESVKPMPKKVGVKEEDDIENEDDSKILEKEPIRKKGWKDIRDEEKADAEESDDE
jgi:uncharacterized protein YdiU (UPF0061 family)